MTDLTAFNAPDMSYLFQNNSFPQMFVHPSAVPHLAGMPVMVSDAIPPDQAMLLGGHGDFTFNVPPPLYSTVTITSSWNPEEVSSRSAVVSVAAPPERAPSLREVWKD